MEKAKDISCFSNICLNQFQTKTSLKRKGETFHTQEEKNLPRRHYNSKQLHTKHIGTHSNENC